VNHEKLDVSQGVERHARPSVVKSADDQLDDLRGVLDAADRYSRVVDARDNPKGV
jgi:hypothetical protein